MNQDAEIDRIVKVPMLTDMVNMLSMKPYKRLSAASRLNKTGQKFLSDASRPKNKSTTWKELSMLNETNFKQILKAEDYLILLESEEEFLRRGNYRRAFPTLETVRTLSECFDVEKPNNLLLWKYLELKSKGVDILAEVFNTKSPFQPVSPLKPASMLS